MKIAVTNNIVAIKQLLETIFRKVENIEHIGDFKFKAKVADWNIIIYTEPTNEDTIDILDIRFEDAK